MPKINKFKEVLIAIGVMIFATAYYIASLSIKHSGLTGSVGAATLPRTIAIMMFILGGLQLSSSIKELKNNEFKTEKTGEESKAVNKSQGVNVKAVMITLIIIIAYVSLIYPLGYIFSTILFLMAMFIVLSQGKKKNYIFLSIIAIGVTVPVYHFFRNMLHLMLP